MCLEARCRSGAGSWASCLDVKLDWSIGLIRVSERISRTAIGNWSGPQTCRKNKRFVCGIRYTKELGCFYERTDNH